MKPTRYIVPLEIGPNAATIWIDAESRVVLTFESPVAEMSPTEAAQLGQAMCDAARDAGQARARRQR